jgi:hypothetical protein
MSDELFLNGKTYVSSKKAAESTGYARDYIGQLARGHQIDAERVGGLWYVSLESLRGYEKNAEIAKAQPPVSVGSKEADSALSFEGKEYISASRASKLSGYNQDYVGQLARGGKIPSRQIGNRWYVDSAALVKHKAEKDALLAAVQAESVGLKTGSYAHAPNPTRETQMISLPKVTYMQESSALMPMIPEKKPEIHYPVSNFSEVRPSGDVPRAYDAPETIQSRVSAVTTRPAFITQHESKKRSKRLMPISIGVLTIILMLSVGITATRGTASFATIRDSGAVSAMTASAVEATGYLGDIIEDLVSPELIYERGQ